MEQSSNASDVRAGDRPLSARSVMASLLLGRRSARAAGRDLVRWCGLFGIAPGTARVALHRMVAAGELGRDGGDYVLLGGLARRQREQEASLTPRRRGWRGSWRMAVVVADARPAPVRAETRVALRRSRLAEWREGVWLRPDNIELDESPHCEWLDARPDSDPVDLAAHLFAPARWSAEAARLITALDAATQGLTEDAEAALAPAFLAGAAAVRHVRADPLLPDEIVPAPWPGDDLRAAYVEYQRAFAAVARNWFRDQSG
jgi:phenylacetic acid degradation operon negative regulatory protein